MKAKKSLGQHFLKNTAIIDRIVSTALVKQDDTILEIGPGTGALTKTLLATGARVIAIEADGRAIDILKDTFHKEITSKQLELHHKDIRETDIESLDFTNREYKVVANIPYYISGMLFEKMLSASAQPNTLVFLVQKEVAERIARSKKESILSLSVKVYGDPSYICTVKKGNFNPPPSVDSAVLLVSNISHECFINITESQFFEVLKAGFQAKRKLLINNLSSFAPKNELEEVFSTLNIPPKSRGEDLPLETWLSLTYQLFST